MVRKRPTVLKVPEISLVFDTPLKLSFYQKPEREAAHCMAIPYSRVQQEYGSTG